MGDLNLTGKARKHALTPSLLNPRLLGEGSNALPPLKREGVEFSFLLSLFTPTELLEKTHRFLDTATPGFVRKVDAKFI